MGLLNGAAWLKGTIDGWLETVDNLDPTKKLKSTGIMSGLNKLNPLAALTKAHEGEKHQDLSPSAHWADVTVSAAHRPAPAVGTVEVEVICAGGWTTSGVGDALSAEDCYALLLLDGGVGQTSVKQDAKVPAWTATDRRAFRFRVSDPGATLYVAVLDEDPSPLEADDPIGRCAVGLQALAPGALYDAWFPLTWKATEQEDLATRGRALVAAEPLATAATAHPTQTDSRGAIRLRIKVSWDDGGKALALSALTGLGKSPQYVVAPATKSGKALRENCRFAMYGEGACPHDAVNEPFSMGRVGDHAHELVDLLTAFAGGLKSRILAIVTYRKPWKSVLALVAWLTSVGNTARAVAWVWLLLALDLRDTLKGEAPPADALAFGKEAPAPTPRIARPQLPFEGWALALAAGAPGEVKRTSSREVAEAKNLARGSAETVAVERLLDEWRAQGRVKAADEPEEDDDVDPDDYASGKAMCSFSSMHPLAPFIRPVQRLLLQLLLPLRAVRGLLEGRDDPVATATVCGACFAVSAATFVYAQFLHGYVVWVCGWVYLVLCYALGLALLGPQNYFLVRAYAKKRRNRHRLRALAGFDPKGYAALKIQDFWRHYQDHLKKLAAEAKAKVAEQKRLAKEAEKQKEADKKKKAELAAQKKAVRDAVAAQDEEALDALHARQQDLDLGPILATKHSSFLSSKHEKILKLEDDNTTFTYCCPHSHKGLLSGNHEPKHVHLKNVTQVSLVDASKPNVFKFKTGHKEYSFVCESAADCKVLVMGLRAAASRLAKKPDQLGKKGVLRLRVPAKPFGLLSASVLERRPAFPEQYRSVVCGDPKKKKIA